MVIEELRRFPAFAALSGPALAAVAGQARRVRLPPRRWLVQPGRSLTGQYYLLEGRVRLTEGRERVEVAAGGERARRPVYPAAAGVETLTGAVFLCVDAAALTLPWEGNGEPGMPDVNCDGGSWQREFLSSPLMQRLTPVAWQRVLRAMTAQRHEAGEVIIRWGDAAECCYVLCAGRAEIVAPGVSRAPGAAGADAVLARLEPGALFGEDALITGGVRNASVRAATAGAAVALPAEHFERWLLDAVVQWLPEVGQRRLLTLDAHRGPACRTVRLALSTLRDAGGALTGGLRYAIIGGSRRERALAAFLLAQQGIDARPVVD